MNSFSGRLAALFRKELNQIRRDRRLAMSLIVPPVVQILLFGFALSSDVSNLKLGVVDWSRSHLSRELIASFTQSRSFRTGGAFLSVQEMEAAISRSELDAGLVIPADFENDLRRGRPVKIQMLLNAVNANNAAIGQGYTAGILQAFNRTLAEQGVHANVSSASRMPDARVVSRTAFLYNPGLVSTWFIVTGTFGVLLILNGSLIASTAMIREREAGTVEQLLMTPAGTTEIILAKISPLFILLMIMVVIAFTLIVVVFDVPVRGNMLVVLAGSAFCILTGIGLGTFVATFTKSAQQSQLMAFFINPPLATLSGALTPVEAMPEWLQPVTWLNPIRHFGIITRATLIKGAEIDTLWPHFAALVLFTFVLVSLSVWRFRKQLG